MINFTFFLSVFSSCSWLIFCWKYVSDKLHGMSFGNLGVIDLLVFTTIIIMPILIIWIIFGHISAYYSNKASTKRMNGILEHAKRSHQYSDLIARSLIENEQSVRAGFILSKFDFFISELNEIIAEIIKQLGTSEQKIQSTWAKIKNGEKWAMGNLFIEISNQNSKFNKELIHMSKVDDSLAEPILKFCTDYQGILSLLEKYDRDKFFQNIIEAGVFGKIFFILSPVYGTVKVEEETDTFIEPKTEIKTHISEETIQVSSTTPLKKEKPVWYSSFFERKKEKEHKPEKNTPVINKDSFYMFIDGNKSKPKKDDGTARKEPILAPSLDEDHKAK